MYEYEATLIRVIDGDTVVIDIDLGCRVTHRCSCRLLGINAPERGKPGGSESTIHLICLLNLNERGLIVHTHKDKLDKYGRYLVEIWTADSLISVNEQQVTSGHAVKYIA